MQAFLAQVQLEAMVRTQSMSVARIVFLISLVVFFIVLFVAAYVWMRRPNFGQPEGHHQHASSALAAPHATSGSDQADYQADS
jgi:heme/copper-type cytochrome/quinol oxidase subunit 3